MTERERERERERESSLGELWSIDPAIKSRHSSTVEYKVTDVVRQRYRKRYQSYALYCEILQRKGADECRWVTKAQQGTHTGTFGTSESPQRGCSGLLLISCSIHNNGIDRWSVNLHLNLTSTRTYTIDYKVQYLNVCFCSSAPHCYKQFTPKRAEHWEKYLVQIDSQWWVQSVPSHHT